MNPDSVLRCFGSQIAFFARDTDDDNNGVPNTTENCALTANPSEVDVDHEGIGDPCDMDDDNDGVLGRFLFDQTEDSGTALSGCNSVKESGETSFIKSGNCDINPAQSRFSSEPSYALLAPHQNSCARLV